MRYHTIVGYPSMGVSLVFGRWRLGCPTAPVSHHAPSMLEVACRLEAMLALPFCRGLEVNLVVPKFLGPLHGSDTSDAIADAWNFGSGLLGVSQPTGSTEVALEI